MASTGGVVRDRDSALADWISPVHLSPEAIARYRRELAAHTCGFLVLHDFLVPAGARALRDYLGSDAAPLQRVYGAYKQTRRGNEVTAQGRHVDEAEWHTLPEDLRYFQFSTHVDVLPEPGCDEARLWLGFRDVLTSSAACAFFAQITQRDLATGPLEGRVMYRGDFSGRHSDVRGRRSAGYNVYLSSSEPGDGGTLTYFGFDDERYEILPAFNTSVIFDVHRSREHVVAPVLSASPRISINGWYVEPAPAPGGH
jgi:hypothetical protein